jgi:hypothetical protein
LLRLSPARRSDAQALAGSTHPEQAALGKLLAN